ncbi:hypothetical protein [Pedobacter frigoris]|uniref:hypothetical protein n=1 Tax=Pedobacter frigoris TaxID=2571272 RepID=UPI00293045D3|nr:hypothetical protein [Pedobacter frigoris]
MGRLEIKCPHCKQWTEWEGKLHDRCKNCDQLIEEEKITRLKVLEETRKAEEELENARLAKQNPYVRKVSNFATNVFIGFILIIIAIIILHTG